MNFVDWGDAARFANWLHNGQPTGAQGTGTTEDGAYFISGATTAEALMQVVREPDATWVIPSEDEWYKAAYHKNDGVTGNYYNYPTSSNSVPDNDLGLPRPRQQRNVLCQPRGLHHRRSLVAYAGRCPRELREPLRHVRPGRQRVRVE